MRSSSGWQNTFSGETGKAIVSCISGISGAWAASGELAGSLVLGEEGLGALLALGSNPVGWAVAAAGAIGLSALAVDGLVDCLKDAQKALDDPEQFTESQNELTQDGQLPNQQVTAFTNPQNAECDQLSRAGVRQVTLSPLGGNASSGKSVSPLGSMDLQTARNLLYGTDQGGPDRTFDNVDQAARELLYDYLKRHVDVNQPTTDGQSLHFYASDFATLVRREGGSQSAYVPGITNANLLCSSPGFIPMRNTTPEDLTKAPTLPALQTIDKLGTGVKNQCQVGNNVFNLPGASFWVRGRIAGCFLAYRVRRRGGIGKANSTKAGGKGRVAVKVTWPARQTASKASRYIPSYASSLYFELYRKDTPALRYKLVVNRPDDKPGEQTAQFDGLLPVGLYTLAGVARTDKDGQGDTVAGATSDVTVTDGATATVALTLGTSIKTLEIQGQPLKFQAGGSLKLDRSGTGCKRHRLDGSNKRIALGFSTGGDFASITPRWHPDCKQQGTIRVKLSEDGAGVFVEADIQVTPVQVSVQGTVHGAQGTPIDNVRVDTTDDAGKLVTTQTGSDGTYSMVVSTGQRVITFSKCGFTTTAAITVVANTPVTVDGMLPASTGANATAVPSIQLDPPQVNTVTGTAAIQGIVTQSDESGGVIIVNGTEARFFIGSDGRFSYDAILNSGVNTIRVRATNCQGTTLSDAQTVNFDPSAGFLFRVTLTWDGEGDADLHVWAPDGTHAFYGNPTIPSGGLDTDNVTSLGPENFTCQMLQAGTYSVGVDSFNATGRNVILKVSILSGPNKGQAYTYGPYTFTDSDSESNYPVTGNTSTWWRPVDIITAEGGQISVAVPGSTSLNRSIRALQRNSNAPRIKRKRR